MTGRPTVHDRAELDGEVSGARAVALRREQAAMDLAAMGSGWSLESLSDDEFARLLDQDRKREARTKEIILNRLEKGVDYGSVPGIPKPFAWEGTGDAIAKLFRWSPRIVGEPRLHFDGEVLTATVEVGLYDISGRLLGSIARSCSTRERRFKNQKTGKWKFDEPREATNEVVSMAFKRAKLALTLSVSGAKKFFANPEQLEEDDDLAEKQRAVIAEKAAKLVAAVKAKGITTKQRYAEFVTGALGAHKEDAALTVEDYDTLLAAAEALP